MDKEPVARRTRQAFIAAASAYVLATAGCGLPNPSDAVEDGLQGPLEEMPLQPSDTLPQNREQSEK